MRLTISTGDGGAFGSEGDFNSGGDLKLRTGNAGFITLDAGDALGFNNNGGYIQLSAGNGANPNNQGGYLEIVGGDDSMGLGGGITIKAGNGLTEGGGNIILDAGNGGNVEIHPGGPTGLVKIFDSVLWASNQTFTFPNSSGTFSLLEADQTWSGLNKFEAGTNSTIYVGSSVKSGCIAIGDSDGSGVTYVTANDGVLSASTTKPSICQ